MKKRYLVLEKAGRHTVWTREVETDLSPEIVAKESAGKVGDTIDEILVFEDGKLNKGPVIRLRNYNGEWSAE